MIPSKLPIPSLGLAISFLLLSPLASQVVQYDIVDSGGRDLPAKITFLLPDGKTPEKLDLKSRLPEFASRKNVIYELQGKGEIPVPAGRYKVFISHGMEWSIAEVDLKVAADRPASLRASLERLVDTRGYLSGDLHLHTKTFSGHGDANVEERLITLAAENIEWAVATDHNHITDYAPYARRIGADRWLVTTPGNEVSTSAIGHFNTYPLDPKSKPVKHDIADARELFKLMRGNPLDEIIQVNHPRWTGGGGGYFRELDLSTIAGDAMNQKFSFDFDSMEILNDNSLGGWELVPLPVRRELDFDSSVREDWFNLLNRGFTFTGVGNSDSHDVNGVIGGCPRNFIASPADDPAAAKPEDLVRAVREGRVSVSSGLFVTLKANGKFLPGSRAPLSGGEVALEVKVQAAPWIDADKVVVVANGEPVYTADLAPPKPSPEKVAFFYRGPSESPAAEDKADGKKKVEEKKTQEKQSEDKKSEEKEAGERQKDRGGFGRRGGKKEEELPGWQSSISLDRPVVRFQKTLRFKPKEDTWYMAYAKGDQPPYPILPKVTIPLGFTNPVWVDADGDGKYTSFRDLAAAATKPKAGAARLERGELTERLSRSTQAFRRQVLAVLAASTSPDRVDPLSELLRDPSAGVREGAAVILSAIAGRKVVEALTAARNRAGSPEERFILNRELVKAGELSALDEIQPAYAAAKDMELYRMRRDLKELCRKNRIQAWWTVGPFPSKKVEEGLAAEYPPEKEIAYKKKYPGFEKKEAAWKRIHSDQGHYVSFGAMSPKENAVAYAHVKVQAKASMKTYILLGAKCGLDIRVNGKSIHRQKPSFRGSAASQMIPVKFEAGASSLLVKAAVEKGDFGFSLMVIDPKGNLEFVAEKLPEKKF